MQPAGGAHLKSTCPGVSMRLSAYISPSAALYRMRAWFNFMVIPRSLSKSMPSRNCACGIKRKRFNLDIKMCMTNDTL